MNSRRIKAYTPLGVDITNLSPKERKLRIDIEVLQNETDEAKTNDVIKTDQIGQLQAEILLLQEKVIYLEGQIKPQPV